eukprot:2346934-Karenia_brevis.AAC.1
MGTVLSKEIDDISRVTVNPHPWARQQWVYIVRRLLGWRARTRRGGRNRRHRDVADVVLEQQANAMITTCVDLKHSFAECSFGYSKDNPVH